MLKKHEEGFFNDITGRKDAPEYTEEYDEYEDVLEEPALEPEYTPSNKHEFYKALDD